ncbi:MAG: carboxypeptidase regulatory-like domain-containing protein [Bacteroidales bacterium]
MRNIYLTFLFGLLFSVAALAQQTPTTDLNGDIIPGEAIVARDLKPQTMEAFAAVPEELRGEWTAHGPWGGNIRGFATDATNGMQVTVACGSSTAGNGGMWYSQDGGVTWNSSNINNKIMYGVAAHPTHAGKFYAGGKYGIYQSVDGGASWNQIAYPSTTIIGIGVQAVNPQLMVAGIASNQGVRYSTDGGTTWNNTNLATGFMKDFAVSAANPSKMFLAVSGTAGFGLFTSVDGATWTAINPANSGQCYGVYVDPANADFLLLGAEFGIYKSVDGGVNWTQTLSTSNFARGIVKYNNVFRTVVYGGDIYESANNGDTWTAAANTFPEKTWQAVGVSAAGPLFGNWGSIIRGQGQQYVMSVEGLNNVYVHCIAYYADRNELWAGSEGSGIWRSTDMGLTWENKSTGLQGWWSYGFAPTNDTDWQNGRMLVGTNNGVFYSDNFGDSWQVLHQTTTYYTGVMIDPDNADMMWVGGSTGPVEYTTNGGTTWNTSAGLPFAFYPRFNMCKNSSGGLRVLISYEQLATETYYSDDLGANYTAATGFTGVSYFTDLSVRPAGALAQMVYQSTDKGIYKSADGAVYTQCPNLSGMAWSVLGTTGTDVYAGAGNGVFHSPDEGQTWQPFNTGIQYMAIWDLAYGNTTDVIFAGTRGYSVYAYGLNIIPAVSLPFNESFDDQELPEGWQNVDNAAAGEIWQFDNPGYRTFTGAGFDDNFAILDSDFYGSGSGQDADLITPPINCGNADFVLLKFDQSFRQYQSSVGTVSVSNNGTAWTTVYEVSSNSGYPDPAVTIELNISAVAANEPTVWVKWNYVGDYDYWWAIDNVLITDEPVAGVNPPQNLTATVINNDVALTWVAPARVELQGYNAYRDGQKVNTNLITGLAYADANVPAGTHVYTVTAVYDMGESVPSAPVQVTIDGETGKIQGFVRDAVTNLSIADAQVTATNNDNGALAIATPFGSHYSMLLPAGTYNVTCSAEGYQTSEAVQIVVEVGQNAEHTFYLQPGEDETLTGLRADEADAIRISPNPAAGSFLLTSFGEGNIRITNQSGLLMMETEISSNKQTIDISRLPAGLYFVFIKTETGMDIQKLVIK